MEIRNLVSFSPSHQPSIPSGTKKKKSFKTGGKKILLTTEVKKKKIFHWPSGRYHEISKGGATKALGWLYPLINYYPD